jgi:preprotein translocase subunit SecF
VKPINLVPIKPNLNFIGRHKLFLMFSAVLVIFSLGLFMTKSLNYGIDFQGGILIEIRTPNTADISQMRNDLSGLGLFVLSLFFL